MQRTDAESPCAFALHHVDAIAELIVGHLQLEFVASHGRKVGLVLQFTSINPRPVSPNRSVK